MEILTCCFQVAFIGVINPLNPRVETPEEVCAALVTAAKYIDHSQLGSTDDCGALKYLLMFAQAS